MTTIITKNSSTATAVPTTSDLVQGELAVNVADKRIFTEDATTTIVELGTNPSTVTTATADVTGVLTANGTLASSNAVVTGGTIDGTPIGVTTASTVAATTLSASAGITGTLTGDVTGALTGNVTGNVTGNITGDVTGNVTAASGTTTLNNLSVSGTADFTNTVLANVATPVANADAANKLYVDTAVADVIDVAPAALDTLNELAAALGDDANFSTTITNSIATKLPLAGGTMSGAIAMGTSKVTGLGDPTGLQDAATKTYVDTADALKLPLAGGTMSGAIAMGTSKITGVGEPTLAQDVTSKSYVDGILGSATAAATSASNAATSESNASTSASNAATSETNAGTSETNAAASYDAFDDRYLGSFGTAPTVDNDGAALLTGAIYWDTATTRMEVYTGTAWQAVSPTVTSTNGSDLTVLTGDDITFADNSKAIFGAGSDLQIYHDGSNSWIQDLGTGNLVIRGTNLNLQKVGGESYITMVADGAVTAFYDNAPKIATTSTGIDVTGTARIDGLTVDGDAVINLSSTTGTTLGQKGGLELFASSTTLGNGGELTWQSGAGTTETWAGISGYIVSNGASGSKGHLLFGTKELDADTELTERVRISNNGDVSFYEPTGTTPKFFWDASAEALGIGTSAPSTSYSIDAVKGIRSTGTAPNFTLQETDSGNQSWLMGSYAGVFAVRDTTVAGTTYPLKIEATTPTNTLYLDSAGNVGIGTSAPLSKLHISTGSTGNAGLVDVVLGGSAGSTARTGRVSKNTSSPYEMTIRASDYSGASQDLLLNDLGGNVGIGTTSPTTALDVAGTVTVSAEVNVGAYSPQTAANLTTRINGTAIEFGHGNTSSGYYGTLGTSANNGTPYLAFSADADASGNTFTTRGFKGTVLQGTLNGDLTFNQLTTASASGQTLSERLRLDSLGNLLVGTTSVSVSSSTGSVTGSVINTTGLFEAAKTGTVMELNRLSANGTILNFRRDGTTVGSIGTSGLSNFNITSKQTGHGGIEFGTNNIMPMIDGLRTDDATDLGKDNYRWKDLYLSGTATMDGLTVASAAPLIEVTDTDTPVTTFMQSTGSQGRLGTSTAHDFFIYAGNTNRARFNDNGDISFYNTAGTSQSLFWDASTEALGIGTSSPSAPLHVAGNSTGRNTIVSNVTLDGGSSVSNPYDGFGFGIDFIGKDYGNAVRDYAYIYSVMEGAGSSAGGGDAGFTAGLSFYTNGGGASGTTPTERMRIDASGAVKINGGVLELGGEGVVSGNIHSQESLYINSDSNGTPEPAPIVFGRGRTGSSGGTEDMRLDGAGNLLVGTTVSTLSSTSTETGLAFLPNGASAISRSGLPALYLNRLTSDGDLMQFRKDGTTVGSIGTFGDHPYIGGDSAGNEAFLRFWTGGTPGVRPSTSSGSNSDATLDLGSPVARFKDLFLSSGVYLGGTVAANKLDDYEEGTWTPTAADATSGGNTGTTGTGTYTKTGNTVRVTAALPNVVTTGMTAGNVFYVQGFPFGTADIAGLTAFFLSGGVYTSAVTTASTVQSFLSDNGATASAFQDTGGFILVSDITSGVGDFYFTAIYQTA